MTLSLDDFYSAIGADYIRQTDVKRIFNSAPKNLLEAFSILHYFALGLDPLIKHRADGACLFAYGIPHPKRWRPIILQLALSANDGAYLSVSVDLACSDKRGLFNKLNSKWKTLNHPINNGQISLSDIEYIKSQMIESYTILTNRHPGTKNITQQNYDSVISTQTVSLDIPLPSTIEDGDDDEMPLDIKDEDKVVTWDTKSFSTLEINRKYNKQRLILQPDFQRDYVWKNNIASRFIESILLKLPIPIVYLAESNDGKLLVIDGQQRLTTIIRFITNNLMLTKLQVLTNLNGCRFGDLNETQQAAFEDYQIITTVLAKTCNPNLKFDMFERLNTGSVKLNKQELRNCIYRGEFNNLLKRLAESPEFLRVVGWGKPDSRMKGEELALRFFAINSNKPESIHNFDGTLSAYMRDNALLSPEEVVNHERKFRDALNGCRSVFGNSPFRTWSKARVDAGNNGSWEDRFSSTVFEVLMTSLVDYPHEILIANSDAIREEFIDLLCVDQMFIDSLTFGTNSNEKIAYRNLTWRKKLHDLIGSVQSETRCFTLAFKQQLYNANPTCALCGQRIHLIDDAAVDHIEHYWRGGKTVPENARLTHRYCNQKRGAKE